MTGSSYLSKSFNDLGVGWNPNDQPTTLMLQKIKALCAKPISKLDDEELRLATSQRFNLNYLLEVLVVKLTENPLRSGDMYDADVLIAALKVPIAEWGKQDDKLAELREIAAAAVANSSGDKKGDWEMLHSAYQMFEDGLRAS